MAVIAKMYVGRLATIEEDTRWYGGQPTTSRRHEIRLDAVTDGSEENKVFWKWTPNGRADLTTKTKELAEQFRGGEFYITFEKVESLDAVPKDAFAFTVTGLGNDSHPDKLYGIKLRCVNQRIDVNLEGTIELGTVNEAAAREFLGFGIIAVRFQRAPPKNTP